MTAERIVYTFTALDRPQDRYFLVPGTRTVFGGVGTEADDALFDFHGALVGAAQERARARYLADGYEVVDITGGAWPAGRNVVKWQGRNGYLPIESEGGY